MTLFVAGRASAATTIDGPVDLGTAATFGVLAGSTVTNTGTSVINNGDVGVSPGTSITGFPPGVVTPPGVVHAADAQAASGQADLTTAYGVAASLTPTTTGLSDLVGLSLVPGVYSGGALSLSGTLTLTGSASSVWVFQAASTLVTASASNILVTGGASACNVFWQVGSSATLGSGSNFVGTIMADQSITATTSAVITGRLLARTGAVTLDTNTLTAPTGCGASGTVSVSPTITSAAPPAGSPGTPYAFTVTSTGTPPASYAIGSGALPPGLVLNSATGVISGTPTTAGSFSFTIVASNGTAPSATASYTIVIAPTLAESGTQPLPALLTGAGLLGFGVAAVMMAAVGGRRRRRSS
ncbi:ice-binding family protein [Lysinimonas soli]|uniref:Ice-binding family protein n=1 Tax=Lysinimonas soli TaxID=1074233 RepID=A0ABW0NJM3_9MICO